MAVLKSGSATAADFIVLCTGWGDLGLPLYGDLEMKEMINWQHFDQMASSIVD